jgi:hypothetical protein
MKFNKVLFALSLGLLSGSVYAQKAVLIEDPPVEDVRPLPTQNLHSGRVRGSNAQGDAATVMAAQDSYTSAYEMRAHRRMGVGAEVMGELGMAGAFVELNFTVDDSAVLGFGGGLQYSSFEANWRHVFGGRSLSPYISVGIAHWYTTGDGQKFETLIPGALSDKFLTSAELETGKFSLNFFAPAAGLQYNMLSGPYTGFALRAEALMLTGLRGFQSSPMGSLGGIYYF